MKNMVDNEQKDVTPSLDNGVIKTIINPGEGVSTPTNGCTVTVHYTGKLTDGTVFDSSRERDPFEFELGKGSVIKAWDIGIATMKKGEVAVFECKPEYAYGENGSPPKIPPNSTLIFEVEMLSWKLEDLSPNKDGGVLRTILEVSKGFATPSEGATVDIHLTGEYNGNVFEDRDVMFPLGEGSEYGICEGVEKALEKFRLKEKSKLEIKSKYAFGSKGNAELNIPPNADVVYTVTLNNYQKLKSFWTLNPSEKIEQAEFFKEKGTNYFKQGKYPLACKIYKKMEDYCGNDVGFKDEELEKQKELKKVMHLNIALCYLKVNKNVDARHECDNVLEMDPKNEKALFRRGMSYLNSGEPELALKDFEEVLKIDPKNGSAIKSVQQCKETLKKQRSQEKKIYANMFEKFAKHDKESKDWVYGWWDGKKVKTDLYVPPVTEEEELNMRRKERKAILEEFERKKEEMAAEKEKILHENDENKPTECENQSTNSYKKEEEERKQLPDVMKTLGEWGQDEREREPTNFEKENPNIFMLDGTGDFKNM